MSDFKKVQAGDPLRFPAPMFNALVDVLNGGPRTGAGQNRSRVRCAGILDVQNDSGADLDVGATLGIDSPLFMPDDNLHDFKYDPSLIGVEPSVSDHAGKFAVALEPIRDGSIGPCAISGVVPVRVYVNSFSDTCCDVVAAETVGEETVYLGSGASGAQILWWEAASSEDDGTIVWAIVRLGAPAALIPFELKDDCAPGGMDLAAWKLTADGEGGFDAPDYEASTDLVVHDGMEMFRAIGYDNTAEGVPGARGFCDGSGIIVNITQQAKLCLCQLTAAKTGSDASFSVDNVTPVDGGQSPVTSSSATLTAYNKCAGAGADNAVACIAWNEESDHWEVQWIVNVSQAVVTSYQVDTTNLKLQKKTRTLWGNWVGSESDWTDVHTGDDCEA